MVDHSFEIRTVNIRRSPNYIEAYNIGLIIIRKRNHEISFIAK